MEKNRKLTTKQFVGLVSDHNSIMAQMPSLFDNNQQSDESEIMDLPANKAPRTHNDMLILQGFNPKTGDLATFIEQCKRVEITDNIAISLFTDSDEDSDTMKNKSVPRRIRNVKTSVKNVAITP